MFVCMFVKVREVATHYSKNTPGIALQKYASDAARKEAGASVETLRAAKIILQPRYEKLKKFALNSDTAGEVLTG